MEILCLMGLFPKEFEEELLANSIIGVQNAANKLQWNIVRGLDAQSGVKVRICNSIYTGAYPRKYKKMRIPNFKFSHRAGAEDLNAGFLNIPYVKVFSRYFGVKREIDRWACEASAEQKVLLVYALTMPFVQLAAYTRRKFPGVKVCVVVPDLPEYMNVAAMQKGGFYARAKRLEIKLLRHSLQRINAFVLLTDLMKDWFDHEIRYTVVEGIAEDSALAPTVEKDRPRNIIYAGGIKREYGVADLVTAFMAIPTEEWTLTIYGDGDDLEYVQHLASTDSRIRFPGSVPNAVVVGEQKKASLLVNPRKNQELAKYSFPSKILEYMSSGTPMLAYKLDGVPPEYDPFYYRIEPTEDGFVRSLRRVMQLSDEELREKGTAAYQFVKQEKTPVVQGKKIVDFLSSLQ